MGGRRVSKLYSTPRAIYILYTWIALAAFSSLEAVRENDTLSWYFEAPPAEVVSFLLAGIKPRTQYLYRREYGKFLAATEMDDEEFQLLPPVSQDNRIALYLVRQFNLRQAGEEALGRTEAGYLVSHMRYVIPYSSLPLSHRVCGVWTSRSPPVSAWPLTRELCEGLAGAFVVLNCMPGAICCLFTFSGLLRIGGALQSKWKDWFSLPSGRKASLYLPDTKRGPHGYVPFSDPGLINIMRWWKDLCYRNGATDNGKIFKGLSYSAFRRVMIAALRLLKLPDGVFRSHSLRRGGATALLQETQSVEYCVLVGRWKAIISARKYLRAGEAVLARLLAQMTGEIHLRIATLRWELERRINA